MDFGNGRKLEAFDGYILDRPSPAATTAKSANSEVWSNFDARFDIREHHRGHWECRRRPPDDWALAQWFGRLALQLTDFGHLGAFPEQIAIWKWLKTMGSRMQGLNLLNLFAYTGGASLALAKLGAQVVHVDAAKNIVQRASDNARASALSDRPIRWIVDDAQKFLARQMRRNRRFDGFLIDPPTFGHGAGSARWQIEQDFPNLLQQLNQLCPDCRLIVVTCHSAGYDESKLKHLLLDEFAGRVPALPRELITGPLELCSDSGGRLPSGYFARWFAGAQI